MIDFTPIPDSPRFQDLTGQPPFGRWTVLGYAGRRGKHFYFWCQCACGSEPRPVSAVHLKGKKSKSCGCYHNDLLRERNWTHRRTGTREYIIWKNMLQRCCDPGANGHANYGGRGITVCGRWQGSEGFSNFLADMGPCPSPGHSIDRHPNNDGGYWCGKPECPECGPLHRAPNCRWATRKEQCRNKRGNRPLTFQGETLTAIAWAERLGLNPTTLYSRLDRGWSVEEALGEPIDVSKRSRR